MNIEQERAAFEAWYQHHHGDRDVYALDESGEYADKQVQGAFNVWQARAALQSQDREDAERLDWLDSMNAKLNSHYGTTYRWKLVLSPNVVRLMSGAGGNGHVAAIDLHDSEAH